MSLLGQPFATPSRVKGAFHLVCRERGKRIKREAAEALLSPRSLKGEDGDGDKLEMVRRTIDECVNLGLFVADDGFVALNPALPQAVSQVGSAEGALPGVILDLILAPDNDRNADFAAVVAWFLGFDAMKAPGTWEELGPVLQQHGMNDVLALNATKYDNMEYWSRFLGLTTVVAVPVTRSRSEERLIPDPTDCLRRVIGEVLVAAGNRLPAQECIRALGDRCPLFEYGTVRDQMDQFAPSREPGQISSSTSLGILRLKAEGSIDVQMRSDAEAIILVDGLERIPVSEIVWLGKESVES